MSLIHLINLLSTSCLAETPYLSVGNAKARSTKIFIEPFKANSTLSSSALQLRSEIEHDLSGLEQFQPHPQTTGSDFSIKGELLSDGPSRIGFQLNVFDQQTQKTLLNKRYTSTTQQTTTLAHMIANDITQAITGAPGIFMSKIAMTCDRSGHKEIYIMDWDGKNPKQITHHKSTAFAPSWNPQGNKLAYSVFTKNSKNIKTISLFEYDFVTKKTRVLSDRPGINSGANYHPTKNLLALTMSYTGNPEIFTLDPSTQSITKLTKSYGVEVDPSWSPDGQQLVFISSRNGNPMVYKMNADGTGATRLTFVGKYNATPHWSPANNKIVFASWTTDGNKNGFDLFIMNPDATKLERLTKNQGSNEDPQFSPDGQSVVYTSTRAGGQNIFVTSVSGQTTRQLSQQLGNCTTPKWSTPNPQLP